MSHDISKAIEDYLHGYETPASKIEDAYKLLKVARYYLNRATGDLRFYSLMLGQLELQHASLGTCATDGKKIYFDAEFICGASPEFIEYKTGFTKALMTSGKITKEVYEEQLEHIEAWYAPKSLEEIALLLLHEVEHPMRAAWKRQAASSMDLKLLNKAQDYVINNRLAYSISRSFAKSSQTCKLFKGFNGRVGGCDMKGILEKFKEAVPFMERGLTSEKYAEIKKDSTGKEYLSEWTTEQIYYHLKEEEEAGDGDGGDEGFDIHIEITEETAEQVKNNMISSAKRAGSGATPGHVVNLVDELLNPKIKWQDYLDAQTKSLIVSDMDYSQPAPEGVALTQIFQNEGFISDGSFYVEPSYLYKDTVKMLLVLDTSGSFSDQDIKESLSEVAGLLQQYSEVTLHVLCFDTSVHNYQVFHNASVDDITNYQPAGRGGTQFSCVTDWLNENPLDVDSMVVFTDGWFEKVDDSITKVQQLLWVIIGDSEFTACDYGKVLPYE